MTVLLWIVAAYLTFATLINLGRVMRVAVDPKRVPAVVLGFAAAAFAITVIVIAALTYGAPA